VRICLPTCEVAASDGSTVREGDQRCGSWRVLHGPGWPSRARGVRRARGLHGEHRCGRAPDAREGSTVSTDAAPGARSTGRADRARGGAPLRLLTRSIVGDRERRGCHPPTSARKSAARAPRGRGNGAGERRRCQPPTGARKDAARSPRGRGNGAGERRCCYLPSGARKGAARSPRGRGDSAGERRRCYPPSGARKGAALSTVRAAAVLGARSMGPDSRAARPGVRRARAPRKCSPCPVVTGSHLS